MRQVVTIELQVPASCSETVFTQIADWAHAVYPHYSPSVSSQVVDTSWWDDMSPIELD